MPAMGAAAVMRCTVNSQTISEIDRAASTDARAVSQALETRPGAGSPLAPIEVSGSRAATEKCRKNTGALRGASDRAPQSRRSVRSVQAPGGGGRAGESAVEILRSLGRQRGMLSSGRARPRILEATMSKPPSASLISWMGR